VHFGDFFAAVTGCFFKLLIPAQIFPVLILQVKYARKAVNDQIGKFPFLNETFFHGGFGNSL
jgi:hypothetical protein